MNRPDLIDAFLGLSLFKQIASVMMLGPLVASAWMLIADWKRPRDTQAIPSDTAPQAENDAGLRKAA
jgi:hypothetical protein